MIRTKGGTRPTSNLSWPATAASTLEEGSGFSNENRAISGDDSGAVPLTKDERPWIRWPVTIFMILVCRPVWKACYNGLLKFWHNVLLQPKCFVFLLILFLLVGIPALITLGFLSPHLFYRPTQWVGTRQFMDDNTEALKP